MDQQYFSRAATWNRMGENLVVHDSHAPRMITMEPWHETVFLAADGKHTVDQFVRYMETQYDEDPPPGLREQVHGLITVLEQEGILRLHDQPQPLPPYLAEELHQQPPEVRQRQMEEDGFIPRQSK